MWQTGQVFQGLAQIDWSPGPISPHCPAARYQKVVCSFGWYLEMPFPGPDVDSLQWSTPMVTSKLDYSNSLSMRLIWRLQLMQNASAWLLMSLWCFHRRASSRLCQLYSLLIENWIQHYSARDQYIVETAFPPICPVEPCSLMTNMSWWSLAQT